MFICTFRYKPEHVRCCLCTEYNPKAGCTAQGCPWLAERIEAGVVGYYEAVQETFGQQGILPVRLWPLIASFPGTLWQDSQHPERMERAKARLGYYRRRDTPAYYAALFLMTSSAELWRRTANCFYRQGFEPAYADRRGISLQDYALLSAARDLYGGTVPTAQDLPNRDLVDDEALRLIVNATLIARYGLPALDIRERGSKI